MHFPNGDQYDGSWENGVMHGHGAYREGGGGYVYRGPFEYGVRHSSGGVQGDDERATYAPDNAYASVFGGDWAHDRPQTNWPAFQDVAPVQYVPPVRPLYTPLHTPSLSAGHRRGSDFAV